MGTDALKSIARGLAAFVAVFTLLNVLGEIRKAGFDANHWWIDLPLPEMPSRVLLLAVSALLLLWTVFPRPCLIRRALTTALVLVLLCTAIKNSVDFYRVIGSGTVASRSPIPFSLFVAAALGFLFVSMLLHAPGPGRWRHWALALLSFSACTILFPVAQMFCFGWTDYRRPADAIVVLGAKAYADGRPSIMLADRVRTACILYNSGLARTLIFSGGPGDGAIDEPAAMKNWAMKHGIPERAIMLDPGGLNTSLTVENTCVMLDAMHARRVMVVSHFYHLPRIKMTYQRHGREVYTVPAKHSWTPSRLPWYIAREVAALWMYYLRPLSL